MKDIITYEVIQKEHGKPNKSYLDIIIVGAKQHGLPSEWISKLKSFSKL